MTLLVRPREGRLLGGVCAGLAHAFTLDVTLVRLAFIVLGLAWGIGLAIYGALWLLSPDRERNADHWRQTARSNLRSMATELNLSGRRLASAWKQQDQRPWPLPLGRRWMALALICFGALIVLASVGAFGWLTVGRAFGLAVIAIGGAIIFTMGEK